MAMRSVLSDVIGHEVRPDGIKVWEIRDFEPVVWWHRWVCVCGWRGMGDPLIPQAKWQGWHDSEIRQEVAAQILLAAYEEGLPVAGTNIYSIDCYLAPNGGRAHIVGIDRGWEAWSMGTGDLRSDPRWGKDLDWMAQELMEGFASYFGDGETFAIVDRRIIDGVVYVHVDVTGEPDDEDEG